MGAKSSSPTVVTIASGKGGVGRSVLVANLGVYLATMGKRVVLVDGAFSQGNLHGILGCPLPKHRLDELLDGTRIEKLVEKTDIKELRLIGAATAVGDGETRAYILQALNKQVRNLKADFVIIDAPAGIEESLLDLCIASDVRVLGVTPEVTSIEGGYRLLRLLFERYLDSLGIDVASARDQLVSRRDGTFSALDIYEECKDIEVGTQIFEAMETFVTMWLVSGARSKEELELGNSLNLATRRGLGCTTLYLGYLEEDEAVAVSVRRRRPLCLEFPESRAGKCIERISRALLNVPISERKLRLAKDDNHYEVLDITPSASSDEVRKAHRRMKTLYGKESVVTSGLFDESGLQEVHAHLDAAYAVLMDGVKRKEYDQALFPDGIPAPSKETQVHLKERYGTVPAKLPPLPEIGPDTTFTGALLRQIREARGINLREVAERSKVSLTYLQAIEEEDTERLPEIVYVRGFLMEYCRVLGVDRKVATESYLSRHNS